MCSRRWLGISQNMVSDVLSQYVHWLISPLPPLFIFISLSFLSWATLSTQLPKSKNLVELVFWEKKHQLLRNYLLGYAQRHNMLLNWLFVCFFSFCSLFTNKNNAKISEALTRLWELEKEKELKKIKIESKRVKHTDKSKQRPKEKKPERKAKESERVKHTDKSKERRKEKRSERKAKESERLRRFPILLYFI